MINYPLVHPHLQQRLGGPAMASETAIRGLWVLVTSQEEAVYTHGETMM